jgi:hypothetical protein
MLWYPGKFSHTTTIRRHGVFGPCFLPHILILLLFIGFLNGFGLIGATSTTFRKSLEACIPRNVPKRQWNVVPCWKIICTLMTPDRISEELNVRKGTFGSAESWEGSPCAKKSRNASLTWHFQGESLLNGENRGFEPSGHPVQLSK